MVSAPTKKEDAVWFAFVFIPRFADGDCTAVHFSPKSESFASAVATIPYPCFCFQITLVLYEETDSLVGGGGGGGGDGDG